MTEELSNKQITEEAFPLWKNTSVIIEAKMMQSRRHSLLEATLNTLSGFVVTMIAQAYIYPLYHIQTTTLTNFSLALWFTLLSIARSYLWRRTFNYLHLRGFL